MKIIKKGEEIPNEYRKFLSGKIKVCEDIKITEEANRIRVECINK